MQDPFEKCYNTFDELAQDKKWKKSKHEPSEAWVILIDGERVTLASGKSLWKERRFASCALTHELKDLRPPYGQLRDIDWYTFNKRVIKSWMSKHAEIITLSEWRKRGRP